MPGGQPASARRRRGGGRRRPASAAGDAGAPAEPGQVHPRLLEQQRHLQRVLRRSPPGDLALLGELAEPFERDAELRAGAGLPDQADGSVARVPEAVRHPRREVERLALAQLAAIPPAAEAHRQDPLDDRDPLLRPLVDVARRALRPRREQDLGPPPVLLVARHGQDREPLPPVGASRYRSGEATELEGGPLPKQSAGILLYRVRQGAVEVLLVHPGGPFWAKKDLGAWSIPKGEYQQGEDPLAVALREFEEETGHRPSRERPLELGAIRQRGGKVLSAWALAGDLDADATTSNTFTLEWPPRSGRRREFPEVDRAGWFDPATAREKLNPAQAELVDRLLATLAEQPERGR